jgi:hypothetical protein
MKAIALKVRESICQHGEFCHAVNQIFLASFGASVMVLAITPLA